MTTKNPKNLNLSNFFFDPGKLYRVDVTTQPIIIDAKYADMGGVNLWNCEKCYLDKDEIMMFLYKRRTNFGPRNFFLWNTEIIFFKGDALDYLVLATSSSS
jgi:hypothetical protein